MADLIWNRDTLDKWLTAPIWSTRMTANVEDPKGLRCYLSHIRCGSPRSTWLRNAPLVVRS